MSKYIIFMFPYLLLGVDHTQIVNEGMTVANGLLSSQTSNFDANVIQPITTGTTMQSVVAIQGNQALLEQAAEQLALRQAMAILNHVLWVGGTDLAAELQDTFVDMEAENIANRRIVLENIQKVKVLMQGLMNNKMKTYNQSIVFMDKIRDYERQIKAQSHSELLNMLGSFK